MEKEPLTTDDSDDEQFAEFLLQVEQDCVILWYDEATTEGEFDENDPNFEKPLIDFQNEDAEKRLEDLVTSAEEALENKKGRQNIKFNGMNLTVTKTELALFKKEKKNFLKETIKNLPARFPEN